MIISGVKEREKTEVEDKYMQGSEIPDQPMLGW